MKTKWNSEKENRDGSGFTYYRCQCPQPNANGGLDDLYELCYSPTQGRLWFWSSLFSEHPTIRMNARSWDEAETVKRMLTKMQSHWMEPSLLNQQKEWKSKL